MGVPDGLARCSSSQDEAYSWSESYDCMGYELNSNGYFYNATPWEEDRAGTGGAISWLKAEKGDQIQHDYNAATATIDLLGDHKNEPFFIACGFVRPHVPLVAPKRYFDRYDLSEIVLPDSVPDDWKDIPAVARTIFGANFHITDEEHLRAIRAYYACVSFVDDQVGRLLDALDSLGLRQRTHIVFVSDHGVQLGEHDLWFKKQLFRESVNTPLIVSSPSFASQHGAKTRRLVELVDIFPSVLEMSDLAPVEGLEGLSFVPLLEKPELPWKRAAFTQTSAGDVIGRSVRTEAWCYNEWGEGNSGSELYDLLHDPNEFVNQINNPDLADTITILRSYLEKGWKSALPSDYSEN
jgi:arylsulfatase A-like enzyme